MKRSLNSLFITFLIVSGCTPASFENTIQKNENVVPTQTATLNTNMNGASLSSALTFPISQALQRVTKKPFGIQVSPKDSPVSPERFSGYHTGTDFETFSSEQNSDVAIYAICTGPLILTKRATGYGGVAVQQCTLDQQDVTVVYGHLKLSSITLSVTTELQAGEQIGILGKGFSSETDGERKHLHLGIHKGKSITLAGYVSQPAELQNWIDPMLYLGK